ncbi:MAG: flagellar basal body rod protein FlgC [Candidatus Raymondbacteria bacterium RifOxyA12_full_50_37]|uniref:Flagellar basal-body rod protein FlgC n=1 Tax=Candidatus Raymondbacteria bacterium RIFOXYD12_FULL_49_13 TaxID=1817890 RepID=A0A1F7EZV2_UNCRA|nr:MAG: flagellar basal body rod protein FlgC [Candidatus Raymondbacteria bacterium RifOxyA12_full_50_37]OGJ93001.1 MAG: flagellar basal body rod protein FlgC [Candidatus Raymondbacteria bacterium RIFOXYA2_FULL_49_16]OGJ93607.1 MAG: flagellar basal body rod protein FlgC [Candidatus Raymondbacteria bacterium RifOxyB12_full_50_8]OGJ99914.1 MAG: flagellar basal body rod protein FlgC [Candidatus Raymondbacteria bacterium RIFOXYD12_FULL_49_13]OGK01576.1 MAG: flagellar basal body rod protein FlgC [Ca
MPLVGLFSGINISASGLRAQRIRQNVISSNLANAETTRTKEGGPYKRQFVVLESNPNERDYRMVFGPERLEGTATKRNHMGIPKPEFPIITEKIGAGVEVQQIAQDKAPPRLVYDPTHPDANEQGYVAMPNVNVVQEMTDMITATRAYEANATALGATKGMLMKALEI